MRNPLARWMADDTFTKGGDLTDTDTVFAGRDKVVHAVLGGLLWFALWGFVVPLPSRVVVMGCAVVAWEFLELVRFALWVARGQLGPWPLACDRFSWRDILAGLAGALLVELPLLLRGLP